MAIHVALNHKTRYRYDRVVSLSPHVVRLRPAPHSRTPILSYSLKLTPPTNLPDMVEKAAKITKDAGGPYGIGVRGSAVR